MRKKRRLIGAYALTVALAMVAVQALPAGAATPTRFGAKLTSGMQPSNAEGGQPCDDNAGIPSDAKCTWVSTEARGRPNGGEKAPKSGTIVKIRLISCIAGSFVLQFARVKPDQDMARVVRNGPKVNYVGDASDQCGGDQARNIRIQTYPISVHVNKGDYIAFKTRKTGTLYCSGGGGVLLYAPPLSPSPSFQIADGDTGCLTLIELQYQ